MKTNNPLRTLVMVLGVLCTANALYTTNAYAEAGFIQFVYGDARIILSTGGERPAQKGAQFNEGDTLVTGRGASVQLRMIDGALVAIRPDSRLKIETYQYSGREDGKERGALALAHGGFRTLTGAIGSVNKDRLVVSSPSATIGIRGTDHEIVHIPVPAPGETALGVPGTYNKVNVGETYMESKAGRINIGPNQVGFAAFAVGIAPVRLQTVPPFLRATPQQQGRDNRRQGRESTPNDQRRIAQQPQQQQQQQQQRQQQQQQEQQKQAGGPPPGEGEKPAIGFQNQPGGSPPPPGEGEKPAIGFQNQPGGSPPPPGEGEKPAMGFQNQPGGPMMADAQKQSMGFQNQGPAPRVEPPPPMASAGSIPLPSSTTQALTMAPNSTVFVGGDYNPSNGISAGLLIQGEAGASILFGQDGLVAQVARSSDGFSYTRSSAPNVAPGSAVLSDGPAQVAIQWGIYAGGNITAPTGSRAVPFFHFMSAQGTPQAAVNTLSGSYSNVLGSTKLISENGVFGGAVTSVSITVNNGNLTGYNLQAVDAQARTWTGNCTGCTGSGVPLTQFSATGINLAGTGAGASATGKAQGTPIGPSGAGMVSSFNLKTTAGQGVTGSFVAK